MASVHLYDGERCKGMDMVSLDMQYSTIRYAKRFRPVS